MPLCSRCRCEDPVISSTASLKDCMEKTRVYGGKYFAHNSLNEECQIPRDDGDEMMQCINNRRDAALEFSIYEIMYGPVSQPRGVPGKSQN